ncbi:MULTISPECIES: hypothetical protein [unclassified Chelatococcus]|uniref:hypothetical protein n=1 Tax=unclassified Chelatococcus TaxID=2638111 RepID=UPI0020BE5322|nr:MULTISPECIES: hypothetical protein [unclassified Chelatococcus]
MQELLHRSFRGVRSKFGFLAYPLGAFASHSTLRQLVPQLDFKFGPIEPTFPPRLWDKKLSPLLAKAIGGFGGYECGSGKNELQAINLGKL